MDVTPHRRQRQGYNPNSGMMKRRKKPARGTRRRRSAWQTGHKTRCQVSSCSTTLVSSVCASLTSGKTFSLAAVHRGAHTVQFAGFRRMISIAQRTASYWAPGNLPRSFLLAQKARLRNGSSVTSSGAEPRQPLSSQIGHGLGQQRRAIQ